MITGRDTDWAIDPNAKDYNPQFITIRGAVAWDFTNGLIIIPKGLGDAEVGRRVRRRVRDGAPAGRGNGLPTAYEGP